MRAEVGALVDATALVVAVLTGEHDRALDILRDSEDVRGIALAIAHLVTVHIFHDHDDEDLPGDYLTAFIDKIVLHACFHAVRDETTP